jgi:hypothetical protein
MMSRTVKGIYRNGEVRLLEKPDGVEDGDVVVTLTNLRTDPAEGRSQEDRRQRALVWLRGGGWNLGGAPYPARDELHNRTR